MLFLLFPVCGFVVFGAVLLFVARQLLLERPAVARQHGDAPDGEPGPAFRDDGTPRYVDSTARPTGDAPVRVPEAGGRRA